MKTSILFLAACLSVQAQNVAVWTYGPNTNGIATNFPVSWVSLGTNTVYKGKETATATVMTMKAAMDLKAATQASMDAYLAKRKSDEEASAVTLNAANVQALMNSYSNLAWCADNWGAATNLANLRIAVKACGDTLLKLRPVLTEWYQKSQQP